MKKPGAQDCTGCPFVLQEDRLAHARVLFQHSQTVPAASLVDLVRALNDSPWHRRAGLRAAALPTGRPDTRCDLTGEFVVVHGPRVLWCLLQQHINMTARDAITRRRAANNSSCTDDLIILAKGPRGSRFERFVAQ